MTARRFGLALLAVSVAPIWLSAQDATQRDTIAATLAGRVFIDSTRQPIIAAEVALLDVGKSVLTDERGAFRIAEIPAGAHRLIVRRIGYGPLETTIVFGAGETIDRNIFLARAVTLDSVRTTALRGTSLEFEENRRLGLGHFFTRADLDKVGAANLSTVLASVPAIRIELGKSGSRAFVANNRKRFLEGNALRQGSGPDSGKLACYAQVILDNMLMYSGRTQDEPLFNVNSLHADEVESIEFYAGATQLPARYQSRDADACGVLVIRTRR